MHYVPEKNDSKEVVCKRECNFRHPNDEEFVIRRLKMWCLGYCCCKDKKAHYAYMREYPADDMLFTNEAAPIINRCLAVPERRTPGPTELYRA